jgi:hypothetical protein
METIKPPSWGPPAAYLYTQRLDNVSLAWEYLRRNAHYCSDFGCALSNPEQDHLPDSWGLQYWEDPRIDARFADPHWLSAASAEIFLEQDCAGQATTTFDIWKIPGQKTLWHCGDHLRLTSRRGNEVIHRVRWAKDLSQGDPCRVSVATGPGFTVRTRIAHGLLRSLERDVHELPLRGNQRPSLRALTHMQIFQALDGEAAGASQREIAVRLLGLSRDFNWDSDSRWRTRIRYLLKCGRARSTRGYRTMAGVGTPAKRPGSASVADSADPGVNAPPPPAAK